MTITARYWDLLVSMIAWYVVALVKNARLTYTKLPASYTPETAHDVHVNHVSPPVLPSFKNGQECN
jgi:hypothetical protein